VMASVDNRKKSLVLALSNYLSLDPSVIPADSLESDIKSLYLSIIAASGHNEVNHSDECGKKPLINQKLIMGFEH
ncbi:putative methionine-tRNA ligase-like protein, partial [Trifolium pratense]